MHRLKYVFRQQLAESGNVQREFTKPPFTPGVDAAIMFTQEQAEVRRDGEIVQARNPGREWHTGRGGVSFVPRVDDYSSPARQHPVLDSCSAERFIACSACPRHWLRARRCSP